MSRFLSPADLLDLTGYTRRDAQARWLAEHGYKFDLRAKTASDKETLGGAAALLGHASSDTTRRVYRRGGETVEPLK